MKKKSMGNAPPLSASLSGILSGLRRREHRTIRDYAVALIQLVRYRDANGHDIGFDYEYIREAVLRKFPTVPGNSPHKGRPTKMPYKELQEFSCDLNRRGIKLPFRPFRPRRKREAAIERPGKTTGLRKEVQQNRKRKSHARAI